MSQAVVRRGARGIAGRSGVALLAEEWASEILGLLTEGPFTTEELEARLGQESERSLRYGLRRLIQADLVVRLHAGGPRSRYTPADAGWDLLEAMRALEAWRAWTPAQAADTGLRRLVAQREARLVVRALVEGSLPFCELQRRVPGLSAGTLDRVLSELREQGVVRLDAHTAQGRSLYELGEPARHLGRVAVLSARWLWRWREEDAALEASDLPGLVHLVAPLAKAPRQLDGVCLLAVRPPSATQGEVPLGVWVRAAGGHLSALALQPVLKEQARLFTSPLAWCEALLHSDMKGIEVEGDSLLAQGLVAALAAVVSP